MPETAEELSRTPDVREALAQTSGKKTNKVKAETKDKFWFGAHLLLLLGCGVLYLALGSKLIPFPLSHLELSRRLLRGAALITFLLAVAKAVSVYAIGRIEDSAIRFTLKRIEHLIIGIFVALIAISVLFVNWYAALTAVGVISVIVGLSVQMPMSSFIGWVYILVRRPYRIGDRIKIDDATGDVIDVGYLDTTLWEFGGQYLSTDHPSGRIIKFPNSKVLSSQRAMLVRQLRRGHASACPGRAEARRSGNLRRRLSGSDAIGNCVVMEGSVVTQL